MDETSSVSEEGGFYDAAAAAADSMDTSGVNGHEDRYGQYQQQSQSSACMLRFFVLHRSLEATRQHFCNPYRLQVS